jgi:hypothetical protein
MKRIGILVSCMAILAACQEEVIVRDSSLANQFSQLNKSGWQVTRNDQPANAAASADPNVRVIRGADFSGYNFSTNFQLDDPRGAPTRPQPLPGTPNDVPPANPYTAPPRLPGN